MAASKAAALRGVRVRIPPRVLMLLAIALGVVLGLVAAALRRSGWSAPLSIALYGAWQVKYGCLFTKPPSGCTWYARR